MANQQHIAFPRMSSSVSIYLGRCVMPSEPRSPRLAVLIDADNASAKIADGLFEEIAQIGEGSLARLFISQKKEDCLLICSVAPKAKNFARIFATGTASLNPNLGL